MLNSVRTLEPKKLAFILSEHQFLGAEETRRFVITNSIVLRNLTPLALICFLIVLYNLARYGMSVWILGLLAVSIWTFRFRHFQWKRQALRAYRKVPQEFHQVQIRISEAGISSETPERTTSFEWPTVFRYRRTRHLFVLTAKNGEAIVIPIQLVSGEDAQEILALLRSRLKGKEGKPSFVVRLLKRGIISMVTGAMLAAFGGDIDRLARPVYSRLFKVVARAIASIQRESAASLSQLKGEGTILLAPMETPQTYLSRDLLDYYKQKYNLHMQILDPIPIPGWLENGFRHQFRAEELIDTVQRAYPAYANDPDKILIAVTSRDMYISELYWDYSLNWRQQGRFAVISTARLGAPPAASSADNQTLRRFRKLLTKNIAVLHSHLSFSDNPLSVLYPNPTRLDELDEMGEDILQSDAGYRFKRSVNGGDPCLTIRHSFEPGEAREDRALLTNCSSDYERLNVEVMETDLRYGLFIDRRTEFQFPDRIPLQFTRALRNQDSRSRAFGIGGNHSLNIFPVGNIWPFTWIDLILADGARIHYRRWNWGFAYWDALYRDIDAGGIDERGSTINWAWPGWLLTLGSGRKYLFPPSGPQRGTEQSALIGIQDGQDLLTLERDDQGNLLLARSLSGIELKFSYDDLNRITGIVSSNGEQRAYRYDSKGRLLRVEANADTTDYRYEERRLSIFHNGNFLNQTDYDENDRVIRMKLANGHVYSFTYSLNSNSEISSVVVYDSAGPPIRFDLINSSAYTSQNIN